MSFALGAVALDPVGEASGYISPGGMGMNGNQEFLADPSRPLIYYADPLGSNLTIADTDTDETWTVEVGTAPMSLDIQTGGSLLYVSVSGMNKIAVVDVVVKQLAFEIPLDFSPLSLTVDDGGRMYVSSAADNIVRVIDASTGDLLDSHTLMDMRILEVSPDGDELIGTSLYLDPVTVSRYSIVGNSLHLSATDDRDLGLNFRQMIPDWDNDRLYLASAVPYGLEVVSIATLDKTGFLQMNIDPAAVALSKDKSVVVGLGADLYSSQAFMFNTTTEDLEGSIDVPLGVDTCVVTNDLRYAILCPGLHRIMVDSVAVPESPGDGDVLGYSPAYLSFVIEQGIVGYSPVQVDIDMDGTTYTAFAAGDGRYTVTFGASIGPGTHEVTVEVPNLVGATNHSWTFSIDAASEDAIKPSIEYVSPPFGADLEMIDYIRIDVSIGLPDPAPFFLDVDIIVDDEWLLTELNEDEEGIVYSAITGDLLPGTHGAMAIVTWDMGNVSYEWPFTWRIWPSIYDFSPSEGEIVGYGVSGISFKVDLGEPEAEPWAFMAVIDGQNVSNLLSFGEDSIWLDLGVPLSSGAHSVFVSVAFDIGTVNRSWYFEVVSMPSMSTYTHPNGYSILAPISWDVTIDEEFSGGTIDIVMRGPVYNDFLTNVLVLSTKSPLVEESEDFLQLEYDLTLEELAADGVDVTVTEEPVYFELSNHSAMEFTIEWDDENIKQKMVAVAVEDREMFLIITCTATKGSYSGLLPIFDAIVASLEIEPLDEEDDEETTDGLLGGQGVLLGGIVTVLVISALVIVVALRSRRPEGHVPAEGQTPSAQARAFCQWCGGATTESDIVCPSCGRGLAIDTDSEKGDLTG